MVYSSRPNSEKNNAESCPNIYKYSLSVTYYLMSYLNLYLLYLVGHIIHVL